MACSTAAMSSRLRCPMRSCSRFSSSACSPIRSGYVLRPPRQRPIAANSPDWRIYTPAPPDYPAASVEDFLSGGLGINDGLRHMSDLETPVADMMRDQSSVDA